MSHQIAIDGPAGAGKSTIAKLVSGKLGFIYVDTGAMYRAMALYLSRMNVNPDNADEVGEKAQSAEITIKYVDGEQVVMLGDENVNGLIRSPEVSAMASRTSQVARLREKLVELQQKLAETENVVMDGRDIGTVVLPNADLKIYLTASVQVRAMRRYKEMIAKGQEAVLEEIEKDIEDRDYRDMHREASPLKQADDAVLVDTSDMSIEEVADKIIELYNS
ncbi:(d)CMP kinase [Butyrivibrio fibrisolvens]|jgi:cytidylate kinase|uniref:Cytidylate kinase n=1 Tax=Butyrivibrio fibrisolvens TaxID=831 RepID=A0A1H9MLS5_BUTFI|nr:MULTISPECIES: (d)CMP kinase [Butyrivibrio]MBQ1459038.1 (d)CMP kinase [Butyrivibrio sp.]MCR4636591.1 (d)CMP kinase [Butyrivibrio sp.]SER24417.1 cytidylate kinase [Butyrivibrio fibrisolvens]